MRRAGRVRAWLRRLAAATRLGRSTPSGSRASRGCGPSPACPRSSRRPAPTSPCSARRLTAVPPLGRARGIGPAGIREASLLLRPYNEALDVSPFAAVQVVDAGDAPAPPVGIAHAHAAILQSAGELHRDGARVLGLGGDHSVALPLVRAAAERHGRLSLLQLDAHTDTWDAYFGEKVTHGTIFRRAAEQGWIDASRSVQIGLRGSMYDGADYVENRALGFRTLLARELDATGGAGAIALARDVLEPPVYITVDIDVLDPAFAPGTGTPEAGGLTSRELLAILRGLAGIDIVAADVVEVAPPHDPAGATAGGAAHLPH